jgi:alkylation response protein AidB-like acyl-CoA dehydrogenase
MGRALLSGPFFASIALAANALLESGDDGAKKEYLPGIASGETIATLAISEEHGGWDQDAIALSATGSGATWNLSGTKRYVPDAHVANLLIVAARSGDGVSLFAVDPAASGVNVEVELTMDQTRKLARITFDNTPARLIGTAGAAWDGLRRALRLAAIALACEQVGGAQHMLDLTVEYAKQRYQFGRPIGSFQAIKHKIADMLVDVESAKSAAYAARRAAADSSDDLERAASVAKAFCSEAYYRTAAEAIQLHGGIGFTWEHQAHLYFKRAKSSEFFLGSPGFHREQIGLAIGV